MAVAIGFFLTNRNIHPKTAHQNETIELDCSMTLVLVFRANAYLTETSPETRTLT